MQSRAPPGGRKISRPQRKLYGLGSWERGAARQTVPRSLGGCKPEADSAEPKGVKKMGRKSLGRGWLSQGN